MSEQLPEGQPEAALEPEAETEEVQYAQIPQDEYESMRQALEQLGPLAEYYTQAQQQQYDQPQEQPGIDPFSDTFQQDLDAYIDRRISPIAASYEEQKNAELTERARDILNDYTQQQGFQFLNEDSAERALMLANHYVAQEEQQFGQGTKAAEAAIARAANEVRDWEQSVGQTYAEQQMNQLRTVSNAPQQPNATGAQAAQTLATPTGGPQAVLNKYYPH